MCYSLCLGLRRVGSVCGGAGGDASMLLCLLEAVEVSEVPEVMRCMLLCMLEAVEGRLGLWRRCAVCYSVCWTRRRRRRCRK